MRLKVKQEPGITPAGSQPIFNCTAPFNWRTPDDEQVLVIGTGKESIISGNALPSRYQEIFKGYLFRGGTELMVLR